jgi:hypothetical protein
MCGYRLIMERHLHHCWPTFSTRDVDVRRRTSTNGKFDYAVKLNCAWLATEPAMKPVA